MIIDKQRDKAGREFVLTQTEGKAQPWATHIVSPSTGSHELGKYYKTEREARNCLMERAGLAFDKFACTGDTIEREVEGFTITARIEHDESYSIDDDDCHNTDQGVTGCDDEQQEKLLAARTAYDNDEWFYGGLVLSVSRADIELDNHAASLWGMEINYPGSDNSHLTETIDELLDEALAVGKAAIAKLVDSVPTSKPMEILELNLPDFWASALINGDYSGLNEADEKAVNMFTDYMVKEYGACNALTCTDEEDENSPGFLAHHDARQFTVLACNCLQYSFDITRR